MTWFYSHYPPKHALPTKSMQEKILDFLSENAPCTAQDVIDSFSYKTTIHAIQHELQRLERKGTVGYCPRTRTYRLISYRRSVA